MPINNVGYREWNGTKRGSFSRLKAIAITGLRISFKSQWIRRMLFISWAPVIFLGIGFFIFEKLMDEQAIQVIQKMTAEGQASSSQVSPEARKAAGARKAAELQRRRNMRPPREVREMLGSVPKSDVMLESIMSDEPGVARHTTWCWLLMAFFRVSQGALMLIMIGLIVPPLISRDLRSRAYLMYFSRPIGRLEYVLGKFAVPATLLAMITLLPGMAVYVFGVMLSPGFSVVLDTWDIPFRIVAASAVIIIPTSLLALAYSSLTYESRFAAFAWFATWGLGLGASTAMSLARLDPEKLHRSGPLAAMNSDWSFLSIYSSIGVVQELIFGLETRASAVLPVMLVLVAITLLSAIVLFRRVTAPINA